MEINLNLLSALNAAVRKAGADIPLNTPVPATLVQVKADGSVVLDVAGQQVALPAGHGADAARALAGSAEGLTLVFSRDASGGLTVQVLPPQLRLFGEDAVETLAVSKLAAAFDDFVKTLDSTQGKTPQALAALKPGDLQALGQLKEDVAQLVKSLIVRDLLQTVGSDRPGPAPLTAGQPSPALSALPAAASVPGQPLPQPATALLADAPAPLPKPLTPGVFEDLIRLAARIASGGSVPAEIKKAVAGLLPLLRELAHTAAYRKNGILLPLSAPAEKVLSKVPAGITLSATVEELKPNGRALLRLPAGEAVEVLPPVPIKKGETLLVQYQPAQKGFVMPLATEPMVSPAILAEVRAAAVEEELLRKPLAPEQNRTGQPPVPEPLPQGLQELAEKVQRFSDKFALPPEERKALVRSLVFLLKNDIREGAVRPELALYRNLQSVGEGMADIVRQAVFLQQTLPEAEKAWVRELLKLLQPFTAKPLLEYEPAARKEQVRKIFEDSGLFFENRLVKLAGDKGALQRLVESDYKALLQRIMDFVGRHQEIPLEVKGRLQQESFRLFQTVEAVQVQTLADTDSHHLLIPLVNSGDEKSAYVTFRRRGKRKPIDGRNTSVTVRVAPSALGEVISKAEIRDNILRVNFFVENEALAGLFRENAGELMDRLSALGYTVAGIQAAPVRAGHAGPEPAGEQPEKRSSFDVII